MQHFLGLIILLASLSTQAASNDLPSLGDATSGLISMEQEHVLGRTWLRNLRMQSNTLHDPVLTEYTENLIYRLASNSQVTDRRLEIVLLDNKQLNAFAVPGGVIGINAGLFLHAQTEAQFAAVLAHELAHLSQRHFARQVEESRKQAPIAMATLLGSIMLLATNNTEAGFAGLMTSQAAASQWALSYSRDWEREADRLGMHTLTSAHIDPHGMTQMFRQMSEAHKYSERPPEFLLTHPVTEKRISDAAARVDTLTIEKIEEDIEYLLMRHRLLIQYQKESHTLAHYQEQLRQTKDLKLKQIYQYSLALILNEQGQYKQALAYARAIMNTDKYRMSYQILHDQILFNMGEQQTALGHMKKALSLNPDNHPLTMVYADMLMKNKDYLEAEHELKRHSSIRKTDPYVWQQLSEAQGKAGNNIGLFQSRGEYLFLTGQQEKSIQQLNSALELSKGNYLLSARIEQRLIEIKKSKQDLKF